MKIHCETTGGLFKLLCDCGVRFTFEEDLNECKASHPTICSCGINYSDAADVKKCKILDKKYVKYFEGIEHIVIENEDEDDFCSRKCKLIECECDEAYHYTFQRFRCRKRNASHPSWDDKKKECECGQLYDSVKEG